MIAPADSSGTAAKVALVTGASGGIGSAIAQELARAGYLVVLSARRVEVLQRVAARIRADGGRAHVAPCDATDVAAVRAMVDDVFARFARLDVLVASAGVYLRRSATEVVRVDVEQMLAANFWSAFELVSAALPRLIEQRRGQIVFINSFDARKGLRQDCPYVVAKAALAGYAATLRQAVRGAGLHVCSVFPGRVDTPMIDDLEVPAISAKIPPERVARAVMRALRRRRSEVCVPFHIKALQWADVLSPRLGDWLVRKLGLDGRRVP